MLYQFGSSRLHGEIILGKCHLRFSRVTVLGDEVTGIAGEHIIGNFAFRTGTEGNHFADFSKMV